MKKVLMVMIGMLAITSLAAAEQPQDTAAELDRLRQLAQQHNPLPGVTEGLWVMRLSMFAEGMEQALSENIHYLNPNQPGQILLRSSDGMSGGSDPLSIDCIDLAIFTVPQGMLEQFMQDGHRGLLQDGNSDSARTDASALRLLFDELLGRCQQVSVSGLHFYFYNPHASRAQLELSWKDKDQPALPPEFHRSDEQRELEQAAGLVYDRGSIPVADITVYFANGG